jgi:hypothetical protein
MSETESIEILSDAGEVLASSPLPDEALIEAREGEVKEFSLVAEVLRDGHAATFRGRDAGGQVIAEGGVIESAEPHDPRTGLLHLEHVDLKRGRRVTLRLTALTAAGVEQ